MTKQVGKITILTIATFFYFSGTILALDAEELVKIYEVQVFRNPKNINAWVNLSKAYTQWAREALDFSKYELANNYLLKPLKLDSTNVDVLTQLARVKSAYHKFNEAITITTKVLKKAPDNTTAWGILGDAFIELGKYKQADSCYKRMYRLDKELYSLARLSHLAYETGDYNKAISFMQKAIKVAEQEGYFLGDQAWANVQLGDLYLSRGKLDQASKSFEKALSLLPNHLPALEHKAEVLGLKGDINSAIEIYENITQKTPDPELKSALAKLYLAIGKKEAADSVLNLVQLQYEEYLKSEVKAFNRHIAEFYLEWTINKEKALELTQKELETRQDIHTYDLLAWAYYKNGEHQKAWENISVALSKNNKDAEILYHAAVIAEALGKQKEAKKYFSQAKSINMLVEKMNSEN